MLPLAETAPNFTAGEFYAVAGVIVFLLTAILLGRKVFVPNPPLHKEFATKLEHAALKAEVDKIDNERRTSTANLHAKVEEQGKAVAALQAETNTQTRQLIELDRKIEELPLKLKNLLEL